MKTKEIDNFRKAVKNALPEMKWRQDLMLMIYEVAVTKKMLGSELIEKIIEHEDKSLSTLRQSVLEEVREKIGEKFLPMDCEDDCDGGENNQGCGCHNDSFNSGLAVARNQVTSLINNLIEEK